MDPQALGGLTSSQSGLASSKGLSSRGPGNIEFRSDTQHFKDADSVEKNSSKVLLGYLQIINSPPNCTVMHAPVFSRDVLQPLLGAHDTSGSQFMAIAKEHCHCCRNFNVGWLLPDHEPAEDFMARQ